LEDVIFLYPKIYHQAILFRLCYIFLKEALLPAIDEVAVVTDLPRFEGYLLRVTSGEGIHGQPRKLRNQESSGCQKGPGHR